MNETPSQTVGPFFSIGLAPRDVPGATATVSGRVLDGAGDPVPDALVEAWQPEGFGRCATDAAGRWTIGIAPADEVVVAIFARGLLNHLVARLPLTGGDHHDIHLQGDQETVFHAV
jgi:protocatechuate 3,4-dioxygenase alpha subunit